MTGKQNKIEVGQRRRYLGQCYTITRYDGAYWYIKWDGDRDEHSSTWHKDELTCDELVTETQSQGSSPLGTKAAAWLRGVADMLEQKAAAYGDSAGNPLRIFTTASPIDMLLIRAEDKLSRLVRGSAAGEDTVADLVGYLALLAAAGWKGKE